jgi:hypothetical protein
MMITDRRLGGRKIMTSVRTGLLRRGDVITQELIHDDLGSRSFMVRTVDTEKITIWGERVPVCRLMGTDIRRNRDVIMVCDPERVWPDVVRAGLV